MFFSLQTIQVLSNRPRERKIFAGTCETSSIGQIRFKHSMHLLEEPDCNSLYKDHEYGKVTSFQGTPWWSDSNPDHFCE